MPTVLRDKDGRILPNQVKCELCGQIWDKYSAAKRCELSHAIRETDVFVNIRAARKNNDDLCY